MDNTPTNSVKIVKIWLETNGFNNEIVWLQETARSAQDAASALHCNVGQIAKSLIFKTQDKNQAILVIASGSNRVNEESLSLYLGDKIIRPDANFVKEKTGFSIGGVPPIAHQNKLKIFLDRDLFEFNEIWAAAGHPHAVFKTTADELQKMTNASVISVT